MFALAFLGRSNLPVWGGGSGVVPPMVCVMQPMPTPARGARRLPRLRDESGIALIVALGVMLVLTIALATTIAFTSAGARHANSSNAGQKAFALAEAGVNNAVSVLHAAYDVTPPPTFPGVSTLLPSRTTTYDTGDVTWSGTLVPTPTGTQWPFEWQITATGTVANPTGPGTSPVTRTQKAVVPVIISKKEDAGGNSVLNWLYASQDLTFAQSVNIATPVYATRDLRLSSTATITAAAKSVAVGRNLILENPQNKIGASNDRIQEAYVHGSCTYKNQSTHTPCQWDTDNVFAAGPGGMNQGGTTIPLDLIDIDPVQAGTQLPTLSCCTLPTPLDPVGSQMGFWYRYSSPGPYFPCATSSGTVPVFDTNTTLDNSAGGGSAQNLTPNTSYSCTTPGGSISWDASANKLKVDGTVYIDGSAYISTRSGTYSGIGTIVLSGTFSMDNQTQMCANATCDSTTWDPNASALVIVANGDGVAGGAQAQVAAGHSIDIKKGTFQGALIANKNIDASVTGTKVIGPMISVNASVAAGQGSDASFPPIHFAPAGTGGITSPPPPGMLLTPRNYAGG
jgi:hypothetical protein